MIASVESNQGPHQKNKQNNKSDSELKQHTTTTQESLVKERSGGTAATLLDTSSGSESSSSGEASVTNSNTPTTLNNSEPVKAVELKTSEGAVEKPDQQAVVPAKSSGAQQTGNEKVKATKEVKKKKKQKATEQLKEGSEQKDESEGSLQLDVMDVVTKTEEAEAADDEEKEGKEKDIVSAASPRSAGSEMLQEDDEPGGLLPHTSPSRGNRTAARAPSPLPPPPIMDTEPITPVAENRSLLVNNSLSTAPTFSTGPPSASSSSLSHIPSHAAIKVIKGEIHNVLTMMRATDQRYVSRSRFLVEHVDVGDDQDSGGAGGTTRVSSSSASHYHPVAQALQDLHAQLTTAVEQGTERELLQQHAYLEAFCQAIQGRDISAPVTGAALAALHKFVLYGFVCATDNSTTGMTRIAQALLECRFEESGSTGLSAAAASTSQAVSEPQHHHRRGAERSNRHAAAPVGGGVGVGGIGIPTTHGSSSQVASGTSLLHVHPTTAAVPYDDEQTVLKLLDVAALTVRTSLREDSVHLMDATTIVRLMDACLHVSHRAERASPLLKSAAASALSQIVLQVFAGPGHPPVMQARREILAKLASLLNPKTTASLGGSARGGKESSSSSRGGSSSSSKGQQQQSHQVIVASSLTLVNIALETCREPLTADEIHILQNDLCKYLLQWSSTTHDLMLLSLTLRVIFNLFQSIRNHLKVPLEVFLTSVHLRILNDAANTYSPEEKEVALESLVEFCQEPALMQDIFLNYDCDVACTNLYEAIVTQLGRAATPVGWTDPIDDESGDHAFGDEKALSEDGGEAGKDSTRTAPRKANSLESLPSVAQTGGQDDSTIPPVTHLQRLGVEGLVAVLDSIAKRCQEIRRSCSNSVLSEKSVDNLSDAGSALAFDAENRSDSGSVEADEFREISSKELHERKLRKQALDKVARVFNAGPTKDAWIKLGVRENLIESETNAQSVAELLWMAPSVDKAKMGIYLSKGPDTDYPFVAAVREAFVELYDFSGLTFAAALRKYLSKFRLPGEAQCIDRLMEAFSKKLYAQQEQSMFKNSDSIYILAFSTIMLNTDLHNPTIKEEQRMTEEQFVRNNRGINGGDDLPADFLKELYDQIKEHEIQVRKELGEFMKKHEHEDFRSVWENMLSKKGEVATPFFTPRDMARSSTRVAGFHDKEMFIALSKSAVQAFSGIFLRSWDDALVVRALDSLRTMVRVAAYLGCDSTINDVLQVLLPQGQDYIINAIATDYILADSASVVSSRVVEDSLDDDETSQPDDGELPIPYGLLCTSETGDEVDIAGSAAHRGLLALDCAFVLMRKYSTRVSASWPAFVECLCLLRDARALPPGLSDLDDFADSSGNILPLSSFAKTSQKRVTAYYRSQSEKETQKNKGWFGFFRKKSSDVASAPDDDSISEKLGELSPTTRTLLAIAEAAGVENVIQMGSTRLPDAGATIQSLLDTLDEYPYKGDPVGEQHAIFSLELAARALLSNKDQATELFVLFLVKFENLLAKVSPKKVPAPFVIERIVVTILRCCIHLYDIPELRPNLRAALHLFFISLPKTFIRAISDRMACGLAIILRASFHFFETHNDWTFMGDTLDMLAHFNTSRVFVFDGIASVVEYALPPDVPPEDLSKTSFFNEDRPTLSKEACGALSKILIRFVLGFYQGDLSLTIPAVLCLEKIYRHRVELILEKQDPSVDPLTAAPDQDYWQNIAVAIYTVCRSGDPELSAQGVESYQRIVLQTDVDQIPDEKWIDILFLMASKQPPLSADISRGNTFSILGQLLVRLLPHLSHSEELRDDLVDLIQQTAELARENLRHGRRGSISPLFEKTLQAVTYLANHMMADEWEGDSEFGSWASETLLSELERVGAAGAALPNQKAVKQQQQQAKPPAPPETAPAAQEQPKEPLPNEDAESEPVVEAEVTQEATEQTKDPAVDEVAIAKDEEVQQTEASQSDEAAEEEEQ